MTLADNRRSKDHLQQTKGGDHGIFARQPVVHPAARIETDIGTGTETVTVICIRQRRDEATATGIRRLRVFSLSAQASMTIDIRGHLPRIEIRVFDPKTAVDQDWQAYHAYRRQRMHDDVPDEPIVSDDVRRRDMTRDWPLTESHVRLALIDSEIAGSAMFWTRRPGTEDYDKHARYIAGDMGVRKDRRRRGVGSALLRTFVTFARDRGYEIATCSTFLNEGAAFLDAVGAVVKQRTRQNRLQIGDIPAGLVDRWAKGYVTHDALRWEIHAPRVPFDRYGELIPQLNGLLNSQPLGTLDHPPLRIDLDQIRTWYANMDTHGGEHIMVLLMHDETVAAMSDVSWDPEFPERSSVGLTGVAPTWRGKGLAKAVKARQLQILTQRQPQVRMVITSNATVNAAMLAVNTQLGFKPHREIRTYIRPQSRHSKNGWRSARFWDPKPR